MQRVLSPEKGRLRGTGGVTGKTEPGQAVGSAANLHLQYPISSPNLAIHISKEIVKASSSPGAENPAAAVQGTQSTGSANCQQAQAASSLPGIAAARHHCGSAPALAAGRRSRGARGHRGYPPQPPARPDPSLPGTPLAARLQVPASRPLINIPHVKLGL